MVNPYLPPAVLKNKFYDRPHDRNDDYQITDNNKFVGKYPVPAFRKISNKKGQVTYEKKDQRPF